jgi:hypothetical protein
MPSRPGKNVRHQPRGLLRSEAARTWGFASLCLLLLASGLLPYDRIAGGPPSALTAVDQMPGDAAVESESDVIDTYRLNPAVRAYLDVRDGRIHFDPSLSRAER